MSIKLLLAGRYMGGALASSPPEEPAPWPWREAPTLDYPWREWQEVLGYLGLGGTLAEEVSRRASLAAEGPRIG